MSVAASGVARFLPRGPSVQPCEGTSLRGPSMFAIDDSFSAPRGGGDPLAGRQSAGHLGRTVIVQRFIRKPRSFCHPAQGLVERMPSRACDPRQWPCRPPCRQGGWRSRRRYMPLARTATSRQPGRVAVEGPAARGPVSEARYAGGGPTFAVLDTENALGSGLLVEASGAVPAFAPLRHATAGAVSLRRCGPGTRLAGGMQDGAV